MGNIMNTLHNMIENITHPRSFTDIIDILIVAVILYELLLLTRHTRGSALLRGLFLLLVIALLSSMFGLISLNWLMTIILQNGALVLIILFQPELRKALEKMGRSQWIRKSSRHRNVEDEQDVLIQEIMQTVSDLSRRKVGALIVFERNTGLEDVVETGTRLNAVISAPLLENIFEPNTPLHDGAVVIRDEIIEAAACILPLAEASGVSRELGTRHRAAVGISETTDAVVIVVSEETGVISMAQDGQLTRPMTSQDLHALLKKLYSDRRTWISSLMKVLRSGMEGPAK